MFCSGLYVCQVYIYQNKQLCKIFGVVAELKSGQSEIGKKKTKLSLFLCLTKGVKLHKMTTMASVLQAVVYDYMFHVSQGHTRDLGSILEDMTYDIFYI